MQFDETQNSAGSIVIVAMSYNDSNVCNISSFEALGTGLSVQATKLNAILSSSYAITSSINDI